MISSLIKPSKQNDPLYPDLIRKFGCRFFDLLAIPQLYVGITLLPERIIDIYKRGCAVGLGGAGKRDDDGVMNANCKMGSDEHLVITWAFELLGRPKLRGRQVGKMVNEKPVFWGGKILPWNFIIGHWDTGNVDGHWTLRDTAGVEIYDSWEPKFSLTGYQVEKILTDKQYLYRVWEEEA